MDNFVNTHYKGEIADVYNNFNIIVAKADFWRYLVLYKYGGIYLDMDSNINRTFNDLIKDNDEAILSLEQGHINDQFITQWCMVFKKNHPILLETIKLILLRVKKDKELHKLSKQFPTRGKGLHYVTGPGVISSAVKNIHSKLYNKYPFNCMTKGMDYHNNKCRLIDETYNVNNIKYRIYGIDYNNFCTFKHRNANHLYINKKHWQKEENTISLYKTLYNIIEIGSSNTNTKVIKLDKTYSSDTKLKFIHNFKDTFTYKFNNNELTISRTDEKSGWGQNLIVYL